MLEYVYIVKCPNCEDEHFYFFDAAKECALGQLTKKPIITQVEVNRNDFGECTDSCDLGTVWSWEDMMKDVPIDSECTTFSKAETVDGDADFFDQEFEELDNSVEPVEIRKQVPVGMTIEALVEEMEELEDEVECKVCEELFNKETGCNDPEKGWLCPGCSGSLVESSKYKDSVEFHYDSLTVDIKTRVIPATLEDPEDYEEGEYTDEFDFEVETSTVEEVLWDEFLSEEDVADIPGGFITLEDDAAWRSFLDVHFEELLEKYNDKFLEYFRDEAEKAAREVFQERYNELNSEGPIDESYSKDPRDQVELEYPELTVTLYSSKYDVDDWDEFEHTDSHIFLVPKVEVATAIWENWITDEDVADVEGGLETLEEDAAWEKFLETHFDVLFEKYHTQILEYFKDEATEDFRERSQEEYQIDQLSSNIDRAYDEWRDRQIFGESTQKPFLEEFDDAETHKATLTDCPECGTVSYDMKEQYCANCGLGL